MYKESWGLKRICPMCSKQYYDLGRTELECPECGKEIEVTTMTRPRRGRKPGSTNAAPLTNPIRSSTRINPLQTAGSYLLVHPWMGVTSVRFR